MVECHIDDYSRIKKAESIIPKEISRDTIDYKNVEYYPLITARNDDAPNFSMRLFKIGLEGKTDRHKHSFEHEVYVLNGDGLFI